MLTMTTNTNANVMRVYVPPRGPGCLVQAAWFLIVGWWLGGLAVAVAWLLNLSIIGLPIGMRILNGLPIALAMQEPAGELVAVRRGNRQEVREEGLPQVNWLLRTLYFLLIGWWWSAVWLLVAYVFAATILLLPLALAMFRLTPFMTTLRRY
jgi:uncharacterized membrane protein YccF (DUF307 family)